jgi:hypothetical protein
MRENYQSSRGTPFACYISDEVMGMSGYDDIATHPVLTEGVARIGKRVFYWDDQGFITVARYPSEPYASQVFDEIAVGYADDTDQDDDEEYDGSEHAVHYNRVRERWEIMLDRDELLTLSYIADRYLCGEWLWVRCDIAGAMGTTEVWRIHVYSTEGDEYLRLLIEENNNPSQQVPPLAGGTLAAKLTRLYRGLKGELPQ